MKSRSKALVAVLVSASLSAGVAAPANAFNDPQSVRKADASVNRPVIDWSSTVRSGERAEFGTAYRGTSHGAAMAVAQIAEPAAPSIEVATEVDGSTVTTSAVSSGGSDSVLIELPGDPASDSVDLGSVPGDLQSGSGQPVLSTELDGALLSAYSSELGVQTLIEIPDSASPGDYAFALDLPEGASLELQPDGSVFVNDAMGLPIALLDVPWAVDANGAPVPTSFHVDGSTVTQIVDVSATTAFPVVADPDLWWVVANSAGCLAEIAGLSLAAAKVVQAFAKADRIIRAANTLGRYYDALGGKMDKVIGVLKKWINNKKALTRKQLNAIEGLIREGGKIVFNVVGLGTCYSLATQSG
jgi:hypothetical protein